jgi:hypothetical protein
MAVLGYGIFRLRDVTERFLWVQCWRPVENKVFGFEVSCMECLEWLGKVQKHEAEMVPSSYSLPLCRTSVLGGTDVLAIKMSRL